MVDHKRPELINMIPFNDLKPLFRRHHREYTRVVQRVMESGAYLLGPELAAFETKFADYLGVKYIVGVGSGTDALTLALRSLGLKNQEVLVPANAYPTAFGVASAQVKMRLCDVDPDTLNVSVSTIKRALTKKTRGVVVVHLYGMPSPMAEIMEFAKNNKLLVIEDCAQAVGAMIGSRHVGTFGHAGCFSFYPTKNLNAMGDGGAVATNNDQIADRIRRLRMYGEDVRYYSLELSTHSRLDEIQAAILRVKLLYLKDELKERQVMGLRYRAALKSSSLIPEQLPKKLTHGYHLFVVKSKNRDILREKLKAAGIMSLIHYPAPIHLQPAFKILGCKRGDFPVAEMASKQVLSLPLYVGLNLEDQKRILLGARLPARQVRRGVSLE